MTKKDLQEYYWLKGGIRKLEDRLAELETKAAKVNSALTGMPKQSQNRDSLGEVIIKIIDTQQLINSQLTKAYVKIAEIENAIEVLPEKEKYLIRSRYIECKSWEQIAVDMNYSWQHIHRLHSEALTRLRKDESK